MPQAEPGEVIVAGADLVMNSAALRVGARTLDWQTPHIDREKRSIIASTRGR
jgi:hypothetical protein